MRLIPFLLLGSFGSAVCAVVHVKARRRDAYVGIHLQGIKPPVVGDAGHLARNVIGEGLVDVPGRVVIIGTFRY